MIPALCRFLRRVFDPRPVARTAPLDEDEWERAKRDHPVTFLRDEREPHLESDRRVDEQMGPRRRFPSTPESRRMVREILAETRKGAQTKEVRDLIDEQRKRVDRWRPGDPL